MGHQILSNMFWPKVFKQAVPRGSSRRRDRSLFTADPPPGTPALQFYFTQ